MTENSYKTIVSSTHVDSHGDCMTLEALEQMRDIINGDSKVRFGVDHNKEFPPKGRLADAMIFEKDGDHYLQAYYLEYQHRKDISWDDSLQIEYFDNPAPFNEVETIAPSITNFSVDPHNFESHEHYKKFLDKINRTDFEFKSSTHFRKAHIPDPEIIFTLAKGAVLYHLIKPTVAKIGEKISEEIADITIKKGKQFYAFVSKTIMDAAYFCIPKKRPLYIVFELNGEPQIELIAKTRDHDLILKSIQGRKLKPVKEEIKFLSTNFEIDKIQFKLTAKGKWKFNYLLTKQGATVGRKETIKKRDKRFDRIISDQKNRI